MTTNTLKLIIAAVLSVALIVAVMIDRANQDWAAPVLLMAVGYVVGNAELTNRDGRLSSPIVSTKSD